MGQKAFVPRNKLKYINKACLEMPSWVQPTRLQLRVGGVSVS